MKPGLFNCLLWLLVWGFEATGNAGEPIRLHPQNPHLFLFRGKTTVLITSGEHYGAVLNRDFDYRKYLATLAADGLNLTRTFSGTYLEPEGAFNITANTLAPKGERFLCPWARSSEPGSVTGGNKFDLTRWDPAYFERLRDFVREAGRQGVVVEFTLFCPMYEDKQWKLSPMNAANNVNGLGNIGRNDVHTLDRNGGLLAIQEALVRKLVAELRDADNLCYEICNEPYFGGVTMEWQHHMAEIIVDAERDFPHKHLITQNIANGSKKIESLHPAVSVINFHYAHPPVAVGQNYALNKAIGDNETGFRGTADLHYRMEAWEFILAGGGLFNHLDYSFTVGHEDGTFSYPPTQPGGGNPQFRLQMKALSQFIHRFDLVPMRPYPEAISTPAPQGARRQVLAEPGRQYAIYFKDSPGFDFHLDLPAGSYHVSWLDAVTSKEPAATVVEHAGGRLSLRTPTEFAEAALRVVRK